jgi:ferredoxin
MTGLRIIIDGVEIEAQAGQTIMEAADAAGIYIPRLCDHEGLRHQGGCRVCTVKANGRSVAACTQPVAPDLTVENETPHITRLRRDLVEMLFHEGNHLCPICEASGNCELQAMAYRLDMTAPTRFPIWSPAAPSMPRIPTSRSTPIAASPAGGASGPARTSMARGSSAMSAGASTAGRGQCRRPRPYRRGGHRFRDLERGLPGRLHHPKARRVHHADRRTGIRQGPDRQRDRGNAPMTELRKARDRHRLARGVFRLSHGDPRHGRAADRSDGAASKSTARR